ncbi:MAG TPA: HEAT repeat domain-containing protein [Candidatus Binataceae bacterium]|nr:HEAT repeat domain-containing protein [Candidatus Binataceae bacterium]
MAQANDQMGAWIEALGDKATFADGWRALHDAGKAAVPAVRDGLSHPNPSVRQFCAAFIDAHWDESALQRLILTLHDPKLKVRKAAVHSLGCDRCKGGQNPIDVLPHLEERIREDKSIKVRRMAVQTLAAQTPNKLIARVLRRVLRDESDAKIRKIAEWGLARYEKARGLQAPGTVNR